MRDFKKYNIWQLSHEFTLVIYSVTNNFPKEEQFGTISQIRRASSSIPTNISEGCGRNSDKEFAHFLNISLGSANEVEYSLILSKDLSFIIDETYEKLIKEINHIKSKIYNLKKSLV